MNKKYIAMMCPKQGEFWAIRELDKDIRKRIIPFFDLQRVSIRMGKEEISIEQHLNKIVSQFKKQWKIPGKRFFLDSSLLNLDRRLEDGTHPLEYVANQLLQLGLQFIPVVGTDRDVNYLEVVSKILKSQNSKEICLRVQKDDLDNVDDINNEIADVLESLEVTKIDTHLLIDLKSIADNMIDDCVESISEFTSECEIDLWKTFTVASSSFPQMNQIESRTLSKIPRTDFALWKALVEASALIGRVPHYGDYLCQHPEQPNLDLGKITNGGKIRYSLEEYWLIAKGYSFKKEKKYEQYYDLASQIAKHEEFLGEGYSYGDEYIQNRADRVGAPGNLCKWVQADSNHHMTLVIRQISNFL